MNRLSLVLVILGALNWLLVGIFGFNLFGYISGGSWAAFARVLYIVVGVAGLWCISLLFRKREMHSAHPSEMIR